jgi:succinate dehydrogenase / fumarate reductase cytochrome b subunit
MGLWLVIFLIEHLLVNSQAALWLGDDGIGFIRLVNLLRSLPYLQVIEILLLGIPFAIHIVWGVHRALTAAPNSHQTHGASPSLPYGRNRAYTWQRLSSWVLVVGVVGHVLQMRFIEQPRELPHPGGVVYAVQLSFDDGLYTLGPRLDVEFFTREMIQTLSQTASYDPDVGEQQARLQEERQRREWIDALQRLAPAEPGDVVAVAKTPGVAILLMVRETFKSPLMALLYTLFVLAAVFHAFNGFWTFLITWGAILSYRSQRAMIPASVMGMGVLGTLGLVAIWGSYWLNLRN